MGEGHAYKALDFPDTKANSQTVVTGFQPGNSQTLELSVQTNDTAAGFMGLMSTWNVAGVS